MSALRISRPGYPVILLDQGPSQANMSGYGGSRIEPRVPKTTAEYQREARAKLRGEALLEKPRQKRATCGKPLAIIGELCARTPGHGYDCKSAAALDAIAASKRSGVGRWP